MHHPGPKSSELGFLPAMTSFTGQASLPTTAGSLSNRTWEKRCLRKHRRRIDDDGCRAKRRRLDEEADLLESSSPAAVGSGWTPASSCSPLTARPASPPQPHQKYPFPTTPPPRPEPEGSCMEVDSAQRRLQEIEERITLEDDDEDEDLDVEPFPRRPVLVLSESLREGLQRGMNDILPLKVAQSVNHSCMELVLWRPPEDTLSRKLKDSLQRQRKQQQQAAGRQPPTPCPSPPHQSHQGEASPSYAPPFSYPDAYPSGEEDMEL